MSIKRMLKCVRRWSIEVFFSGLFQWNSNLNILINLEDVLSLLALQFDDWIPLYCWNCWVLKEGDV